MQTKFMKYIKTFEDINDKVFKKYLVWEMRGKYSIFKFEKFEDDKLYFFDTKNKRDYNVYTSYAKKHLMYMSDNIKDCEIFIDAKKYNI